MVGPRATKLTRTPLAHGKDVRIFTARVNPNHRGIDVIRARRAIEAWCERHFGQVLPVSYEKDRDMMLLSDDRARQVEHNTGRVPSGRLPHAFRADFRGGTERALSTVS